MRPIDNKRWLSRFLGLLAAEVGRGREKGVMGLMSYFSKRGVDMAYVSNFIWRQAVFIDPRGRGGSSIPPRSFPAGLNSFLILSISMRITITVPLRRNLQETVLSPYTPYDTHSLKSPSSTECHKFHDRRNWGLPRPKYIVLAL